MTTVAANPLPRNRWPDAAGPSTSSNASVSATTTTGAPAVPEASDASTRLTAEERSRLAVSRAASLGLLFSANDVTLGGWWEEEPMEDRQDRHGRHGAGARAGQAGEGDDADVDEDSQADGGSSTSPCRSPSPNAGVVSPNAGTARQNDDGRTTPGAPPSSAPSPPSPTAPPPARSRGLLVRSLQQGWERSFELHSDWPPPRLRSRGEVLVRNVAVGLNPVDFKSVLYRFGIAATPWVLGRDVCGVVERVAPGVEGFKPGDRVWTCADSRDVRAGGFQSFSLCRNAAQLGRVPAALSDDEAATLGTGVVTAGVVAFWFFRWRRAAQLGGGWMPRSTKADKGDEVEGEGGKTAEPTSREGAPWVIIYGGGAVTGIYFAQLARLSGYRVLAVASEANFGYLASDAVGVDECVSRYLSEEELLRRVDEVTRGSRVDFGIDCVGKSTAAVVERVLRRSGAGSASRSAELVCLAGDPPAPPVTTTPTETREVVRHRISFSTTFYGDDVFASALMSYVGELLERGLLRPARPVVVPDGLAGVRPGLEALRDGTAPRAHKLVVRVAETPEPETCNLGVRAELGWNGAA